VTRLVRSLLAATGKLLEGKTLTLLCVVVWCCMFWLGLWPFHSPANDVAWLPAANGLRFGDNGTIASAGELQPGARDAGCSIELSLQPARRDSSNTRRGNRSGSRCGNPKRTSCCSGAVVTRSI